jgi:paraquat-inducible protein A
MAVRSPLRLVGCPDCGLIQSLPAVAHGCVAECVRCAHALGHPLRPGSEESSVDFETPLAFAITGLLLLVPAILFPLLGLSAFGILRRAWLPSGADALWHAGFGLLATAVMLFSIAIPALYLLLMIRVLLPLRSSSATAGLGRVFRWALQLRPWAMLEVYLVGCCVGYSRLQSIGPLDIGVGGWCLLGATVAMFLLKVLLDEHSVWDALLRADAPVVPARPVSCHVCAMVLEAPAEPAACPRCAATLRPREADSMGRTLVLVFTGALLYLPANLLPVIRIERFGREQPSTILGGVRELIISGLWPLAVLVFTASILVPMLKLIGLGVMMLATRLRSRRWLLGRTRLYRLIEFVGRWSSIDLFMISILVALVQFGTLTSVRPDTGAMAFAAVVILTMLASRCFDPRVMWEAAERAS